MVVYMRIYGYMRRWIQEMENRYGIKGIIFQGRKIKKKSVMCGTLFNV